jgi:hypothetical protein
MLYYVAALGGIIVGFAGGYLTASFWGKPAKIIKQAAKQGIDVVAQVQKGMR